MARISLALAATIVVGLALTGAPGGAAEGSDVRVGVGPKPVSIDRLAFGPDGSFFVADNQGATIYAIDLDRSGAAPGLKPIEGVDTLVAAMMGTGAEQVFFTDLAVDPKSGQAYVAAMRRSGESALFRIDGNGAVKPVSLAGRPYTSVTLPNPPPLVPGYRGNRVNTVTDMAYDDGSLYVAGLSNEEFASNLRSIPYPFRHADRGTGIEIFHTSHGDLETRSPVYTFLPMRFQGRAELLAAYICTPLVRLPIEALKPGGNVHGTTIAEMGRHNRPLDMVRYTKDGADWLLTANSRRGLLKTPIAAIEAAPAIDGFSAIDTRDLGSQRVQAISDVEQIDLAGGGLFVALSHPYGGRADLKVATLP